MSEGTGATRQMRVRTRGLGHRGTPDGAFGAGRNAAGCSSTSMEGTAASRMFRVRSPGVYLRGAPEVSLETGESNSPEGRGERTDRQGTVCVTHDSSPYMRLLRVVVSCRMHSGAHDTVARMLRFLLRLSCTRRTLLLLLLSVPLHMLDSRTIRAG